MGYISKIEHQILAHFKEDATPKNRAELLQFCASADDVQQVSIALANLRGQGLVHTVGGGRWEPTAKFTNSDYQIPAFVAPVEQREVEESPKGIQNAQLKIDSLRNAARSPLLNRGIAALWDEIANDLERLSCG